MADITPSTRGGMIISYGATSADWGDIRDGGSSSKAVYSATTNGEIAGAVSAWDSLSFGRAGTVQACCRYFMSFNVSSISAAKQAGIYVMSYLDGSNDAPNVSSLIAVETNWNGSILATTDWTDFPGATASRTANMRGNVTDYSAPVPARPKDPRQLEASIGRIWNVINLTDAAISEINSSSNFTVMIIDYAYDYRYNDPKSDTPSFFNKNWAAPCGLGFRTASNSTTAYRPFLRVTEEGDVAKINGVDQFTLSSIGPASGQYNSAGSSMASNSPKINGKSVKKE